MKRRNFISMVLSIIFMCNFYLNVYATEIKDISIKWLNENTVLYYGGDIEIEAYTNGQAIDDIQWTIRNLDGKDNVIGINPIGSKAVLFANNIGRAEIVAATRDDSNSMRHIVVNVENYPQDTLSQSLIAENIVPIQSRDLYSGKRLIQVEANKKIEGSYRVNVVDKYLRNISRLGMLSLGGINSDHERYEHFTLYIDTINNIEIEFRVDKYDSSYVEIRNLIIDIDKYNNILGNTENDSVETAPEVDKPNDDNADSNSDNSSGNSVGADVDKEDVTDKENLPEYIVPKDEITQGIDEIIIIDGYGSDDNPVRLEVNKNLLPSNKIEAMDRFLKSLQKNKELDIIQKYETKEYTAYKIKVWNKEVAQILRATVKNDFFIEILVDKNDKKSYKPIIEMLDKLDKNYTSEENYIDNDSEEQLNNKQENTNDKSTSVNGNSVNNSSNVNDKINNKNDKSIVDENSQDEQLNSIDDKNGVNVNTGVKGTGNRKEVMATILVAGGGLALGGSIFVGRKSFVRKREEKE